ncbi:glycosyltransferase family 9 protein [Nonomuraea angiospora]|uniref:glycosyltransferase family 9 protein n=1 Tax=Nonomuraea angiospora TaxID=46172 RepID=UPI001CEF4A52|nr:glycosyltransferase family 9 protein [Nonomuraea angiospora]
MVSRTVLVARPDSAGDVLLAGPAVRAVGAHADRVVFLAGPRGRAAAELLPGVDRVIEWQAPWIDADPPPVTGEHVARLMEALPDAGEAVILTSFHQSALPLALLLRLRGVGRITAISEDYPGSLLDVRVRIDEARHLPEAERMLAVAAAAGFPPVDGGALAITPPPPSRVGPPGYVVVHPGTAAPARAWPPSRHREAVEALADEGFAVVVTGGPGERALTAHVAGGHAIDLGGLTSLPELAGVLRDACALVAGNTGPAHLAAAVGTPVVSLFSPVVPAGRWAPYGVPYVLLGDQEGPCKDTRARICPVDGHPCLAGVTAAQVVKAVRELVR